MKLKVGDRVYVQRYDVYFFLRHKDLCQSIVNELLSPDEEIDKFVAATNFTFTNFICKPENVAWLMDAKYILDYEDYKNKSDVELNTLLQENIDARNKLLDDFLLEPLDYQKEHHEELKTELDWYAHKTRALEAMLMRGKEKFTFPKAYESAQ